MSRERARSYADRLPPLVPRAEADISHLDDEMADLLYPGRRPRPFRMGLRFEAFEGDARAVELARRSAVYRETEEGGTRRPPGRVRLDPGAGPCAISSTSWGSAPGTEVTVDRQKPPYARELWLPLFWIFVGAEALGGASKRIWPRSKAAIRKLGVEWDKFFAGVEKKPPNDLRTKVDALIRRHAHVEIKNATERFRYQGLTAKYNTMSELWAKKLRLREEGKAFGVHGSRPRPCRRRRPLRPRAARGARRGAIAGEVRVSHPERDGAAVQALYDRFLAARAAAGEQAPVKFESFQKLIAQQASRILTEKGGQAVDFRLETKDGKVSLKAKVVK